ncbi:DUF1264-domain-containing protein [Endogone sp. FLAS-F59071]|nr:DUF1264-domain-containing protein [Endogone sp. FLAS-F59071]|eukprot:RUS17485.1 DUF1264-domain-containing protein [Endogone sp. FLAS-F59071]
MTSPFRNDVPANAPSHGEKIEGGTSKSMTSTVFGSASSLLQSFAPVQQICEHLCAFHFYSHDMTRQVEAHHFCSHINEDMRQCLIYDSDEPNARLIGVEYVISARLFDGLPEDEKKYWHSHNYEVKSGILIMPLPSLTPSSLEKAAVERLVATYGKTWHFWQVDRGDTLPLGPAQLMMSFTNDNQLNPSLLRDRDILHCVDTAEKRAERADIPPHTPHEGADHWEKGVEGKKGTAWQLETKVVEFKRSPKDSL